MYGKFFKHIFDFAAALLGLILLSPVLVAVSLWLCIVNKGSVFFLQKRPGKNGKIFSIIKFKTMTDAKDADGNMLPDDKRFTKTGQFLRSTSLDELPQLINVLKGDMSLVGPRPLLVQYLSLYTARQSRRHEVRPGITGWAQCNGRNAISWREKLELDVWYVDNISFRTDCKIIFMTVMKVVKRADITRDGQTTVELFNGEN